MSPTSLNVVSRSQGQWIETHFENVVIQEDVLICETCFLKVCCNHLDLYCGITLWCKSFLAKVQEYVFFFVVCLEGCQGIGIQIVYCVGHGNGSIVCEEQGAFFGGHDDSILCLQQVEISFTL